VSIDGAFGPTRIGRRPARVAAVGFQRDGDDALALGVTPVAMATSGNFPGDGPGSVDAAGPRLGEADDLRGDRRTAVRADRRRPA